MASIESQCYMSLSLGKIKDETGGNSILEALCIPTYMWQECRNRCNLIFSTSINLMSNILYYVCCLCLFLPCLPFAIVVLDHVEYITVLLHFFKDLNYIESTVYSLLSTLDYHSYKFWLIRTVFSSLEWMGVTLISGNSRLLFPTKGKMVNDMNKQICT